MMAKDDSHWLTISSLVYELISFESKEDNRWKVSCGKVKPLGLEKIIQIIDGHKHRQRSVLQAIVCPQPIIDAYFTGALSSNSWGQLVVGLKILASVSIRFLILWNGSKDESKDVLRRIASQLPSANSIGDLWAKLVQKMKSATDFDDFQACCNALCHCSIAFLVRTSYVLFQIYFPFLFFFFRCILKFQRDLYHIAV